MATTAFERVSRHLALIGSAGVLFVKVAGLVAVLCIWCAVAEAYKYSQVGQEDRAVLGAMVFGTIYLALLATSHRKRPWIWGLFAAVMMFSWFALWKWYFQTNVQWASPQQGSRVLSTMACLCAIGSAAAIGWFYLTRGFLSRMAVTGELSHTFPQFGMAEGIRPAVDAMLLRVEHAVNRVLLAGRGIAVTGVMIMLSLAAWAWTEEMARRGPRAVDLYDKDTFIWLAIGLCAGAVLGVVLAPLGKRRSLLSTAGAMGIAGLLAFVTNFAGRQRQTISAVPRMVIVFAMSAGAMLFACLLAQFIFAFLLRSVTPRHLHVHLLGSDSSRPSPSDAVMSLEACEECGYLFDGLPSTTCDGCGISEIRCPECGHYQPAGTLYARLIQRFYRSGISVRASSAFTALLVGFACLSVAFGLGSSVRGIFNSRIQWYEFVGLCIGLSVIVAPVRIMILHLRPWLLGTVVATALVTLAATLGGVTFADRPWVAFYYVMTMFTPVWLVAAAITPLLWQGWLRVMLPASVARFLYGWQCGLAFKPPRGKHLDRIAEDAGSEIALLCRECGRGIRTSVKLSCAKCGVLSTLCPECKARTPLTQVRMSFESLVRRARAMLLMQICAPALVVHAICCLASYIGFWQMVMPFVNDYGDSRSLHQVMLDASLVPAIAGGITGLAMFAKSPWMRAIFALMSGILWGPAMALLSYHSESYLKHASLLLVLGSCYVAVGVIAAVMMPPTIEALARVVMRKESVGPLLDWLRGRKSMDEATGDL